MNKRYQIHIYSIIILVITLMLILSQFTIFDAYWLNIKDSNYYILIIFSIVVSLLSSLLLRKVEIRFSWVDIITFGFIGYFILNSCLKSSINSYEFKMALSYILVYLSFKIIFLFFTKIHDYIIIAILIAGTYQGILCIKQLYGLEQSNHSSFLITGSFFNPGPCGIFISAVASLALYEIKSNIKIFKSGWKVKDYFNIKVIKSIMAYITFFATSIVIIPIMSRAGWMGFVASLFLMYRIEIRKLISILAKKLRLLTIYIYIILVCSSLVLFSSIYFLKQGSANGRLFIWRNVINATRESPIFGVGVDNFAKNFSLAQREYFISHNSLTVNNANIDIVGVPEYAFNEILSIWLLLGYVGLILVLIILIYKFNIAIKQCSSLTYMGISIFISSMFSYTFYIPVTAMLFLIALASIEDMKILKVKKAFFQLFFLALLIFSIVLNKNIRRELECFYQWQISKSFYTMGNYKACKEDYKELLPIMKNNYKFMFEYGHLLNKLGEYKDSNEVLIQGSKQSTDPMFWTIIGNNYLGLKMYNESEQAYLYSYYQCPNRLYPIYQLVKLGIAQNNNNMINYYGNILINKDPKIITQASKDMKENILEILQEYK